MKIDRITRLIERSFGAADPIRIQRDYYRDTATDYDRRHVSADDEHAFALAFMISAIKFFGIRSVLDVGSGTGRALLVLRSADPTLTIVGIEPSSELRARGHAKGLTAQQLMEGDGQALAFADGTFDLVCAFGVLHHVPHPRKVVGEMLRVARRAVFISDANNFGQGQPMVRLAKQAIHALRLWPLANFIKTRGKGYAISDGDGLFYSYSVFDDYPQITAQCAHVHLLNTSESGPNIYRSASHVAMLGLKC
jgi:ubiquinone/menaquinone biosynthesis C-methylase UbiE